MGKWNRVSYDLIYGVGKQDTNIKITNNGKMCPFYQTWKNMLQRCYYNNYINKNNYVGCFVCEDWLFFSNFKSWMEQQDWEGRQLDKDLLFEDNKMYSPITCCFLPKEINMFIITRNKNRGLYPLGVYYNKRDKRYYSKHGKDYLGCYTSSKQAHIAWQKYKLTKVYLYLEKYKEDIKIVKGLSRIGIKLNKDLEQNNETEYL